MKLLAFAISCLVLLNIVVETTNPESEDFEEDDFESSSSLDDATVNQEEDDKADEPPTFLERPLYKTPVASGNVFLAEPFESQETFNLRWIKSRARKDGVDDSVAKYDGEWSVEEAKENSLQGDLGLVLKNLAKHHAISVKLDKPFAFDGKPLIIQYEVKFQNGQECGGAYIKLLTRDDSLDLAKFLDRTPYTIMFGPDKCGNDNKLHFIFQHKNPHSGKFEEKHAKRPSEKFEHVFTDKKTHLYTLALYPDNQFEIYVDEDLINSGSLLSDVTPPVNPPKEIADPSDKKPDDWDDRERIADPAAKKPEDWDEDEPEKIPDETAVKPEGWLDDEPELIPSIEAEKPSDWDDDVDGEWEPPLINNPKCESVPGCGEWSPAEVPNPKYKGKWHAPLVDNPDYKGIWSAKMISNPDYFEDKEPYKMSPISALGLELWSMSEDIFFDNFIITDDKAVADQWAYDTWRVKRTQELSGSGRSVVDAVMEATSERPWLWVVIALAILLPIMLIMYCCMSSSKPTPDTGLRKKTDAPTEDDRDENEADEEDDEEEDELQSEETHEKETDAGRAENAHKPTKSDLESEKNSKEAELENDSHEESSKAKEPVPSSSPRKRKTKARKD